MVERCPIVLLISQIDCSRMSGTEWWLSLYRARLGSSRAGLLAETRQSFSLLVRFVLTMSSRSMLLVFSQSSYTFLVWRRSCLSTFRLYTIDLISVPGYSIDCCSGSVYLVTLLRDFNLLVNVECAFSHFSQRVPYKVCKYAAGSECGKVECTCYQSGQTAPLGQSQFSKRLGPVGQIHSEE